MRIWPTDANFRHIRVYSPNFISRFIEKKLGLNSLKWRIDVTSAALPTFNMKKRSYHISVVIFEFDMAELPYVPIFVSLTPRFFYMI